MEELKERLKSGVDGGRVVKWKDARSDGARGRVTAGEVSCEL